MKANPTLEQVAWRTYRDYCREHIYTSFRGDAVSHELWRAWLALYAQRDWENWRRRWHPKRRTTSPVLHTLTGTRSRA